MKGLRVDRLVLQRANGLIGAASRQDVAAPTASFAHHIMRQNTAAAAAAAARAPTSSTPLARPAARSFTTSSPLHKKSKAKKMAEQETHNPGVRKHKEQSPTGGGGPGEVDDGESGKYPRPNPLEPLNTDDLTARWENLESHFRDELKKLSTGGRFNPDSLGALPVCPDKQNPSVTYPLRELAQVVPRQGRTISLLAHDKAHVKGIIDAVQGSEAYNQQPQRDPDNELELVMKVEPERKEDLVARAKGLTLQWRERIRHVSEKRKKVTAKWFQTKEIGPDLKKKADQEVQKKQNEVMKVVDQVEKQTLQRLG